MRKTILMVACVGLLAVVLTAIVSAGGNGAIRGVARDAVSPTDCKGPMTYLFNKAGFHFWFTGQPRPCTGNQGWVEGHTYHGVYKYKEPDDPCEWCGPLPVVDRMPFNAGGTAGWDFWYKYFDTTTGEQIRPPCP